MTNKENEDRELILAKLLNQMADDDGVTCELAEEDPLAFEAMLSDQLDGLDEKELHELLLAGDCLRWLQEIDLLPLSTKAKRAVDEQTVRSETRESAQKDSIQNARPDSIGKFVDLKFAGQGGFATVYRAFDSELERIVALKVPLAARVQTEKDRLRFQREAKTAAMLSHPALVAIYEAGHIDGVDFISSEWVEGQNLHEFLKDGTGLTPESAARAVLVLAEGVAHAHSKSVLHRDIKPANVLVASTATHSDPDSRESDWFEALKLADFGLARDLNAHEGMQRLTADGSIMGTPAYMAPEQVRAMANVGKQVDVYSLGVILYELLVGKTPHRRENFAATLRAIEIDPIIPPRRIDKNVPADLDAICMRCLEREPTDRYRSAFELQNDLEKFVEGQPVSVRSISVLGRARRWMKREPVTAGSLIFAFTALLLGLAASSWFLRQSGLDRDRAIEAKQETERIAALRSEAMNSILNSIHAINPMSGGSAKLSARELLDDAKANVQSRFSADPVGQAELLASIARAYMGLGFAGDAMECRAESLAIFERVLGRNHESTLKALRLLSFAQQKSGKLRRSLETQEEYLQRCIDLYGEGSKKATGANLGAAKLNLLMGAVDRTFEEALQINDKMGEDWDYEIDSDVKTNRGAVLVQAYRRSGQLDKAIDLAKRRWDFRKKIAGSNDWDTLDEFQIYVALLVESGNMLDAEPLSLELLNKRIDKRGADSYLAVKQAAKHCWILLKCDKVSEARELAQKTIDLAANKYGNVFPLIVDLQRVVARSYRLEEKLVEARGILEPLLLKVKPQQGDSHPTTLVLAEELSRVIRYEGRPTEASELLRPFVNRIGWENTPINGEEVRLKVEMIKCLLRTDSVEDCIPLSRSLVEHSRHQYELNTMTRKSRSIYDGFRFRLACHLIRAGRAGEAVQACRSWTSELEGLEELPARAWLRAQGCLAIALVMEQEFDEAESIAKQLLNEKKLFRPWNSLMLVIQGISWAEQGQNEKAPVVINATLSHLKNKIFERVGIEQKILIHQLVCESEKAFQRSNDLPNAEATRMSKIKLEKTLFPDNFTIE